VARAAAAQATGALGQLLDGVVVADEDGEVTREGTHVDAREAMATARSPEHRSPALRRRDADRRHAVREEEGLDLAVGFDAVEVLLCPFGRRLDAEGRPERHAGGKQGPLRLEQNERLDEHAVVRQT
jgi:hypothetical protein